MRQPSVKWRASVAASNQCLYEQYDIIVEVFNNVTMTVTWAIPTHIPIPHPLAGPACHPPLAPLPPHRCAAPYPHPTFGGGPHPAFPPHPPPQCHHTPYIAPFGWEAWMER